jgi:hypothetical protein
MGGADIWHTVNALAAFRAVGLRNAAAESFVARQLAAGVGLSYWSARSGLCIETTSAMALIADAESRRLLRGVLQRYALPGGRWASFIIDGPGGYESYLVAPSVTAWAVTALAPSDPLREPGLAYLRESLGERAIWAPHAAFYGTPFYPAHVAAPLLPWEGIGAYALATQDGSGGWGFGDPPEGVSTLPTALAMRVLQALPPTPESRAALARAARWLVATQSADGAFPIGSRPDDVWYAGTVYATCVAVLALAAMV